MAYKRTINTTNLTRNIRTFYTLIFISKFQYISGQSGKSPDGNTPNNRLSTGKQRDQTDSARSEGGRVEASLTSKRSKSGRKYKVHLDGKKYESILYLRPDRCSGRTQTAVTVCSKRQEENSTTSQRGRQARWNLAKVGKVMRAGHRLSSGVGGCLSGTVWENSIVGSEPSECRRAHTLRISAGEDFRSC